MILGIAVVAAVATPTPDPVTMLIAMAPLLVLFELSVLLARILERRRRNGRARGTLGPRRRSVPILDSMLFDLRGRGRRRTVQVIYLTLAILMGGGLVLFGIGGGTNGGLFDAIGGNGGSATSTDKVVPGPRSPPTSAS